MTDRERAICSRIRTIREQIKWSQTDFAKELGISRAKLISIELGHTPLRYGLAVKIGTIFDVQTKWIASGGEDMRPHIPLPHRIKGEIINLNELLSKVFDLAPQNFERYKTGKRLIRDIPADYDFKTGLNQMLAINCSDIRFQDVTSAANFTRKVGDFLRDQLKIHISNGHASRIWKAKNLVWLGSNEQKLNSQSINLTHSATSINLSDVKPHLPNLLERLNRATNQSGKMTELANFLKVPLASVSRWLSGKREPGGEITLQMLRWVEQQERQK